jgi:circadian clock protein KaiB
MMGKPPHGAGSGARLAFRLYVAGSAPNSIRALDNFKAAVAEFMPDVCDLEIIDILEDPLRALNDGILVTPTLLKVSFPAVTIIGNLSDKSSLLLALGWSRTET